MKSIVTIILGSLLLSCGHSKLVDHLQGSDSVSVSFVQKGSGTLIKIVGTSGRYAIQDLLTYTDSKETAAFNCNDDGHITFFKKGIPAGHVSFNYTTDGCHHFKITKDGKVTTTEMNNQAVDLLKALKGNP